MRRLVVMLLALSLPASATKAATHHKRHRTPLVDDRVFVPTPDSLIQQNAAIDALRLPRIRDDKQLRSLVEESELVPLVQSQYVQISPRLEAKRRYCKPWVNAFLQELGQAYYEQFGSPIQVNSAVRTVRTQISLSHWNHNAAPWHGEKASAHLAGIAVDLQRRGLTKAQMQFIQQRLLALAHLNMVIVEEELKQPCFHVVVTGEYPYLPVGDLKSKVLGLKETPDADHTIIAPRDCPAKPRVDGSTNPRTP